MPVLARFYGIIIRMYFQQAEHNPPHIHAIYGEDTAAIEIKTGEILEGYLPDKAYALVREWLSMNEEELLHMWESQAFHSLVPLR
jgi:hypothetical protein